MHAQLPTQDTTKAEIYVGQLERIIVEIYVVHKQKDISKRNVAREKTMSISQLHVKWIF